MAEHIVPVKTYVVVFLILLGFTGLTTGVAYIDLGPFNTVVALAIAVVKMLLVILFFMHVKYSPKLTKLVIIAAFFWFGLLLTFTMADEFTRNWSPIPNNWGPSISAPAPRMR